MVRSAILTILISAQVLMPVGSAAQSKNSAAVKAASVNPRVPPPVNPNLLFEGYSKILIGGAHVGFTVLRYEFDAKKKQFSAHYLVKTEVQGESSLESLKALADMDLKPLSYEYSSLVGKQAKTIDAKFSGQRMTATVKEGKTAKKHVADVPKGAFLGIFLYYVILRSPSGLQTETRYDYKAIAEEDAKVYDGVATVGKEEKFNGLRAFKATNTFKDISYAFYMTDTGDVLSTDSVGSGLKTILVARPDEATGSIKVPHSVLTSLFGHVPQGTHNAVSRAFQAEIEKQKPQPAGTKQEGIPPDPRIMIKGNTTPDNGGKSNE